MDAMTTQQILLFCILAAALGLFAWGRIRYDAFLGFGHPAVITVAAILILSRALRDSGLVPPIVRWLKPFSREPHLQIAGQFDQRFSLVQSGPDDARSSRIGVFTRAL